MSIEHTSKDAQSSLSWCPRRSGTTAWRLFSSCRTCGGAIIGWTTLWPILGAAIGRYRRSSQLQLGWCQHEGGLERRRKDMENDLPRAAASNLRCPEEQVMGTAISGCLMTHVGCVEGSFHRRPSRHRPDFVRS